MEEVNYFKTEKEFNDIFNHLGYSKERTEKRSKIYDNASRCFERVTNRNWEENVEVFVLGSRGEGLAVALGSDIDIIDIQPAVRCFETHPGENNEETDSYIATFELCFKDVPEGYAKLLFKTMKDIQYPNKYDTLVKNMTKSLTNDGYLKNDERIIESIENEGEDFKKSLGWISMNMNHERANGPAQPIQFPLPLPGLYLTVDKVPGFPCEYPSVLDEWFKRVQEISWPSLETKTEIKKCMPFMVPVGLAESNGEILQWRISTTLAERHLVRSFNSAQIKAYVAMKMIAKHELKPICENITSYIVKNVMFWVSETKHNIQGVDDFLEILREAIIHLKDCVETKFLRHYFLSSKNMMLGKISDFEQCRLVGALTEISRNCTAVLQRCPLIHRMCTLPDEELVKGMLIRNLSDELLVAPLAIEPELYDEVERKINLAKNPLEYIEVIIIDVLPFIRKNNPFGYFDMISSKSDEEIQSVFINPGFDQTWMK